MRTPESPEPEQQGALRRLVDAVRDETVNLHVRRSVGLTLNRLIPDLVAVRLRTSILRLAGLSIGRGTVIGGPLNVVGGGRLEIGRKCWINGGCHIDVTADVTLGYGVALAQGVFLITETHEIGGPRRRAGKTYAKPISIGDGCWLGARSVVLPGVTIGAGSIVGAGAVVTDDLPANVVAAGVPARSIRSLEP